MTALPFHPLADIFPLIEGSEFEELVEDIRANGIRDAIVLHDGAVLDGRNRYRALLELQRTGEVRGSGWGGYADLPVTDEDLAVDGGLPWFERFSPMLSGDALDYVFSKNLRRRHLTTGQRAYALAEYETFRHGGARQQDANLRLETPASKRAELAEKGGVSERSIASAATVRDHGVAELKDAVRQGDIAVSRAEEIARLPEQEQPAAVQRALPNGARAIMSSRQEPDDSLDYFPTPPWATRALMERVLCGHYNIPRSHLRSAWEPACGEGHIAEVLHEYFRNVTASDIHEYGYGDLIQHDYLAPNAGDLCHGVDWIITNPPFDDLAERFVLRSLERARVGVAMFLRLQWLETVGRFERIFKPHPPALIAQFSERVPLCKGRWNPDGDTATAYLWLIWIKAERSGRTEFYWIPPGCRESCARPDDVERFTAHPVIKRPATSPQTESKPVVTDDRSNTSGGASLPGDDDLDIPGFLRRPVPENA